MVRTSSATQALTSISAAAGLTLLVPFVILALGTPVALGVRGLLEATRWLLSLFS